MVHRAHLLHSDFGHKYWCEIPVRGARFPNSFDQKKFIASTLKFRQRTRGDGKRGEEIPSKQSLLYLPKCPNGLKATRLAKEVGGDSNEPCRILSLKRVVCHWKPNRSEENWLLLPCFTSPLFTLCSHHFLIRGVYYDTSVCHTNKPKLSWVICFIERHLDRGSY